MSVPVHPIDRRPTCRHGDVVVESVPAGISERSSQPITCTLDVHTLAGQAITSADGSAGGASAADGRLPGVIGRWTISSTDVSSAQAPINAASEASESVTRGKRRDMAGSLFLPVEGPHEKVFHPGAGRADRGRAARRRHGPGLPSIAAERAPGPAPPVSCGDAAAPMAQGRPANTIPDGAEPEQIREAARRRRAPAGV